MGTKKPPKTAAARPGSKSKVTTAAIIASIPPRGMIQDAEDVIATSRLHESHRRGNVKPLPTA